MYLIEYLKWEVEYLIKTHSSRAPLYLIEFLVCQNPGMES